MYFSMFTSMFKDGGMITNGASSPSIQSSEDSAKNMPIITLSEIIIIIVSATYIYLRLCLLVLVD